MAYIRQGSENWVGMVLTGTPVASTGLPDGGYVTVWSDFYDIRAQRYDAAGAPVGSAARVNTTTAGWSTATSVAALSGGGFVVAWADPDLKGSSAIVARLFDANGIATGGEILIEGSVFMGPDAPVVAALADGRFVVTWEAYHSGGDNSGYEIIGRIYDAAGVRVGTEFLVNTRTVGDQRDQAVTGLADGGFVVSWTDSSNDLSGRPGSAIRAQLYDAAGVRIGSELQINTQEAGAQGESAVTALKNGGFVATWTDASGVGGDASASAIKGQLYDAAGLAVGAEFLVNDIVTGEQSLPAVTGLSDGGFVVSWTDASTLGGDAIGRGIKGQVFAANGTPSGSEFLINTSTGGSQSAPVVAALGGGGFVVSWNDTYSNTGGDYIRSQVFAPSDLPPSTDSVAITSGAGETAAVTVIENLTAVTTISTEASGTPTYAIVGGADAARFAIDANSGAVTFRAAPDFEAPGDVGANNVYDIIVRASVGTAFDDQLVRIAIGDDASEPTVAITSHGATARIDVAENGAVVATVIAEGSGAPAYGIVGGADAAAFRIDAATGALAFVAAPDFEAPGDAGADNVYDVVVRASVGSAHDDVALAVAVGDVSEDAVRIVSHGGVDGVAVEVVENEDAVTVVSAEGTGAPAYAIVGGADATLFTVDAETGALSFVAAPDFERPADADGDNVYMVVVRASVGAASDDVTIGVRVGDDKEEGAVGTDGDDLLVGSDAADIIYAKGGDDRIEGNGGDDGIDGGSGNDLISGGTGSNMLVGGDGNDRIFSGSDGSGVDGSYGDIVEAGAGDDYVEVTGAINKLDGGDGYDTLDFLIDARSWNFGVGARNFERVDGEFRGTSGNDWIFAPHFDGATGTIRFNGGDGDDVFQGSNLNDAVFGGSGRDELYGDDGADLLNGGDGDDWIDGGEGNDSIDGGIGYNHLGGGGGDDSIVSIGLDRIDAGAGDDVVEVRGQAGEIHGGAGSDTLILNPGTSYPRYHPVRIAGFEIVEGAIAGSHGNDDIDLSGVTKFGLFRFDAFDGDDRFVGGATDDEVRGGYGIDVLIGGGGRDRLSGDAGDDRLDGGEGDDLLDGGSGVDTATYENARAAVWIDLGSTSGYSQNTRGAGYDMLVQIENLVGSAHADNLRGNAGANRLDGGAGNDGISGMDGDDVLNGGAGDDKLDGYYGNDVLVGGTGNDVLTGFYGNDRLSGGEGVDSLTGGAGLDLFVFDVAPSAGNRDIVRDFYGYDDNLGVSRSVFTALASNGSSSLSASAFAVGTQATTADHRFVYDRAAGALYYDADGSGFGAQVLVATFDNRPTITPADFVMLA